MKTKNRYLASGILIGAMLGFYLGGYVAVRFDFKENWNPMYLFPILLVQIVLVIVAGVLRNTKKDSGQSPAG